MGIQRNYLFASVNRFAYRIKFLFGGQTYFAHGAMKYHKGVGNAHRQIGVYIGKRSRQHAELHLSTDC